jgi:hypothetical protein
MVMAPQLGQLIFTAFSSGATFLPQEMQMDILISPDTTLAQYLKID